MLYTASVKGELRANLKPRGDPSAMLIMLHGNSTYIHSGSGQVLVPERVLSLDDAAGLLGDYPREGVARLVDVHIPYPRLACVPLQVLVEGVGGEWRAGLPRPVVPRPERPRAAQRIRPSARPKVGEQRLTHRRVGDRTAHVVAALDSAPHDEVVLTHFQVCPPKADDLPTTHPRRYKEQKQCVIPLAADLPGLSLLPDDLEQCCHLLIIKRLRALRLVRLRALRQRWPSRVAVEEVPQRRLLHQPLVERGETGDTSIDRCRLKAAFFKVNQ